jgi:hypothetical protein
MIRQFRHSVACVLVVSPVRAKCTLLDRAERICRRNFRFINRLGFSATYIYEVGLWYTPCELTREKQLKNIGHSSDCLLEPAFSLSLLQGWRSHGIVVAWCCLSDIICCCLVVFSRVSLTDRIMLVMEKLSDSCHLISLQNVRLYGDDYVER